MAFAEGYISGRRTTPDLPALLTVLAHNEAAIERAFHGKRWQHWLFRVRHWLNANTKRQAKRNVVAHYDLGNAFYERWLDPTMTYSAALFDGDFAQPLATAQHANIRAHPGRARAVAWCACPRDRMRLGRLCRDGRTRGLPRDRALAVGGANCIRS